MTPPFSTPSKASYFFSGFHSATTSPFFGKLRMCNPSGLAGPQPQQALFGAYCSWRDLSLIVEISQAAEPRFFCQRVEESPRQPFHLRKGGSASPTTMPSPIAEGAIFFRVATQAIDLPAACRRARVRTQFMANVKRAWPDQAIVIVLLGDVRAPAGYARCCEERSV
jgi:hypothetical protein